MVARLVRGAAAENYLVLLVGGAAALMLLGIGVFVTPDTWLALASGRVVAAGGPPSTDSLTAWTAGRDWVDQQWLGQWTLYEIWRLGGLKLVGLLHATVVIATFALALAAARLRGGSARHVALVGLLAVLPIGIVAGNIRTQTFALPLFAAVLWLLSQDSRAPSGRAFWCFPLLVVWANVHGSVIVGAGLVVLAGALTVLRGTRGNQPGALRHGAAMIALAPLALVATPYGVRLFAYLQDTFGNPEIARVAPEWMPTSLEPVHAPFYLLAALTLALLGRDRAALTGFEQLTLVILLAGALVAERNLAWFTLAALLLVAPMLTRRRPAAIADGPPARLALAVAALTGLAVIAAGVQGLGSVERQVHARYPPAAVTAVARVTDGQPSLAIFTHPRYADWLIFEHPPLAGRVPFDIRYELLQPGELRRFRRFRDQIGAGWRSSMGNARLIVLDSSEKPLDALAPTSAVLLREAGAQKLYDAHDVAVVLRPIRRSAAP